MGNCQRRWPRQIWLRPQAAVRYPLTLPRLEMRRDQAFELR
jgi:hypothetical protein